MNIITEHEAHERTKKLRRLARRGIERGQLDGHYTWSRGRVGRCFACTVEKRPSVPVSADLFVGRRREHVLDSFGRPMASGAIHATNPLCAMHAIERELGKRGEI